MFEIPSQWVGMPWAVAHDGSSRENRPPGFPCFNCGVQVTVEQCMRVSWPDDLVTYEAWCGCIPGLDEPPGQ